MEHNLSMIWNVSCKSYMHLLLHKKKPRNRMQWWLDNKYYKTSWWATLCKKNCTLCKKNCLKNKSLNRGQKLHIRTCWVITFHRRWYSQWVSRQIKEDLITEQFKFLNLRHLIRRISWYNILLHQLSHKTQSYGNKYRAMQSYMSQRLSTKHQDYALSPRRIWILS